MKIRAGASFMFDRFGRGLAVCLLLLVAAFNASAFAQDGPKAAAAAKEAAANMQAYLRDLEKTGGQPDYSKPPASEYLKKIFDADALAALPAPKADDGSFSWVSQWAIGASDTYSAMANFGAKNPSPTPSFRVIEHNIQQYEDQIMAASAFNMRIDARMVRTILLYAMSLPSDQLTETRKEDLRVMNLNLMREVHGNTITITTSLKPKNLRLVASALRDTVFFWAPITSTKERTELLDLLEKARATHKGAAIDDDITAIETVLRNMKK